MNFRKQKDLTAIRIRRTYNNIEQELIFKTRSREDNEKILSHLKREPDIYRRVRQTEDKLSQIPGLKLTVKDLGIVPEQPNIPVVAELHYTYNPKKINKKSFFHTYVLSVIFFSAAFIIYLSVMLGRLEDENALRNLCKIYTSNGIPDYIIIQNTRYELNPDWTVMDEDQIGGTFINPWHRTQLRNLQQCIRINSKKE